MSITQIIIEVAILILAYFVGYQRGRAVEVLRFLDSLDKPKSDPKQ